jgi:hypothetical protein
MGLFGSNTPQKRVEKSVKLVKDTAGTPAFSVSKVSSPMLIKKTNAAGDALAKKGMRGVRAQALCVLDYSGSMDRDYQSGAVQDLVERFLAFAFQIDADGEVPIIPFESKRLDTITVNAENYEGVVQRELLAKHGMGSTNLAAALEEVKKIAQKTEEPLFVGVVTDGNPDDVWDGYKKTTALVCELANYPVFIKFLALRDVPYLQKLDDLGDDKRLLDNVDTKTFANLNVSDEVFYEAMADEWDSWVKLATNAGILTS